MKDRLTAVVVTKPHRLGPVVEDFFWHAAVVMEGTLNLAHPGSGGEFQTGAIWGVSHRR